MRKFDRAAQPILNCVIGCRAKSHLNQSSMGHSGLLGRKWGAEGGGGRIDEGSENLNGRPVQAITKNNRSTKKKIEVGVSVVSSKNVYIIWGEHQH